MSGIEAFPTGAEKACRVGNGLTATGQSKEWAPWESPSGRQQTPALTHPGLLNGMMGFLRLLRHTPIS